jgi:hypothetical protein
MGQDGTKFSLEELIATKAPGTELWLRVVPCAATNSIRSCNSSPRQAAVIGWERCRPHLASVNA